MKKHEVAAIYGMRIADMKSKYENLLRQKQQFATEVYKLRTHPKLSPKKREMLLSKYMRGKSYDDWVEYYDDHLLAQKGEISEHQIALHDYNTPSNNPYLAIAAIAVLLGIVAFGIFTSPTGLAIFTPASTQPQPAHEITPIEIPEKNITVPQTSRPG